MSATLSRRGHLLRGEYPLRRYGARGDGSHDDTGAIQAAVDDAAARGGGTLLADVGNYLIGGPQQSTGVAGYTAQVLMPRIARDGGSSHPTAKIRLKGAGAVPTLFWDYVPTGMTNPDPRSCTTFTSSSNTSGAIFGVAPSTTYTWLPLGVNNPECAIELAFENLQIFASNATGVVDPVITAIDARPALNLDVKDVVIAGNTSYYGSASPYTQPGGGGYGLRCPAGGNGARVTLGPLIITGYTVGLEISEHATGRDQVWLHACGTGLTMAPIGHPAIFYRLGLLACHTGINITGGASPSGRNFCKLDILQLDIEHPTTGWASGGYDLLDPGGSGAGSIRYHMGGGNGVQTFSANLGTPDLWTLTALELYPTY